MTSTRIGIEGQMPRGIDGDGTRGGPAPTAPPTTAFRDALRSAGREIEVLGARLDRAEYAARHGHAFTGEALIALQLDAHRYAEKVEVAAKLVDRATQTVKQVLTSQS